MEQSDHIFSQGRDGWIKQWDYNFELKGNDIFLLESFYIVWFSGFVYCLMNYNKGAFDHDLLGIELRMKKVTIVYYYRFKLDLVYYHFPYFCQVASQV